MGQKGAETRDRLLAATQESIESVGYFGTGLNQVIAAGGAPRGSLYFHFPGGKDQLVGESVRRAGQAIGELLDDSANTGLSDAEFATGVLRYLGDRLEQSGWRKGCPVATVALETAASHDTLQEACAEVYADWEALLRARLAHRPDAEDLAVTVLALVEGALLLARTHRSREPLDRVARRLEALLG